MRLPLASLPFIPRKFARQQKIALPMGHQGRRFHIPVRWIFSVVVVLFVLAGAGLLVHAKVFTLQQAEVIELVRVQPAAVPISELQAEANKLQDRSLLLIHQQDLEAQWMRQFPAVEELQIKKQYPHTLTIGYLPRIPMCQLVTPKGNFLVDREGFVFAKASSDHLPTLTTDISSIAVGQSISVKGVQLGLGLIEGLRGINPHLISVVLHDRQLDIQLDGPPLIFVGDQQQLSTVLSQLDTLMAKFSADQKYPKELDFRYDRPVVRY